MKIFKTLLIIGTVLMIGASSLAQETDPKGHFSSVNGLKMYYEIHGSGQPLVLLHGAFGYIEGYACACKDTSGDRSRAAGTGIPTISTGLC
jgi:hypothetical protein